MDRSQTTPNQPPFEQVNDDILFLIFEKLGWIDRIRSRTVCKRWFQQITKIPYNHQGQFPWLFQHRHYDNKAGCYEVKLTDEYSKRNYNYVIDQSGQQYNLDGAQICASKFGWILVRARERSNNNLIIKFFVYCPFNCRLMNLPNFIISYSSDMPRHYTYSSNPSLPDCVFFALLPYPESQRIKINTCKIGDKEWKKFHINLSIPYVRFSVECVNGLLYVVLLPHSDNDNTPDVYSDPILNSNVGTFDPKSHEWKLIKNEKGFMKNSNNGKKVKPRYKWEQIPMFPVVYNNKELYLVREIGGYDEFDVFKYDMEEKQWVEQPSLGNRVLFLGVYGSSFLVDAVGELCNVANNAFNDTKKNNVLFGYGSGTSYYPFSFSSKTFERNRKFYVDNNKPESDVYYQPAWSIPTI